MDSKLKFAFSQSNTIVGDVEGNAKIAINDIGVAKAKGADVILFPELFIPGYLCKDLLFQDGFIEQCQLAIEQILPHCTDITVVIGNINKNNNVKGKALYNSAFVLQDGKVNAVYNKHLLPTYDIFCEERYFESGTDLCIVSIKHELFAISICEDIWYSESPSIYNNSPVLQYTHQDFDALINIAASPYSFNQYKSREDVLNTVYNKLKKPIYYCNTFGAHTNIIFDGHSAIKNEKGIVKAPFEEGVFFVEKFKDLKNNKYQNIEKALILGIKDYFKKLGFKKAILGLSGGVDSALVATLAAKALGAENVHCVMLPSEFSSEHSISDSEKLVKNLGCGSEIIAIKDSQNAVLKALNSSFKNTNFGIAEENIQSRLRALLLMAISNKHGHLLLNTSNKSESAVGYGTLYGDMCGAFAVIADLYKTEVYELCAYINTDSEIIPNNILTKPPSAELRPNQKDSDSLPDYDILDGILYDYIENKLSEKTIISNYTNRTDTKRVLRLVKMAEYKRHQLPPVLRISDKSFGEGRQFPIVAKY